MRENVARYAADGTDSHSEIDGSKAPQIPVAAYSDLLFSFATVEGAVAVGRRFETHSGTMQIAKIAKIHDWISEGILDVAIVFKCRGRRGGGAISQFQFTSPMLVFVSNQTLHFCRLQSLPQFSSRQSLRQINRQGIQRARQRRGCVESADKGATNNQVYC